jgi:uncharacterized membrane protein
MSNVDKKPVGIPHTERILGFSDAVFAIVITLLVLELKIPEIPENLAAKELPHALAELWPNVVSHVISFTLLGIYWVGHHALFTFIKRYDRTLLWLNILFLLFMASMPFPTGLLIRYSDQQISMVIYCVILILTGLSAVAMWWHASRHHRLIDENVKPEVIALTYRRVSIAPVIYLIALATSFLSLTIAKLFLVVAILIYIIPNPLTKLHRHYGHHPSST